MTIIIIFGYILDNQSSHSDFENRSKNATFKKLFISIGTFQKVVLESDSKSWSKGLQIWS